MVQGGVPDCVEPVSQETHEMAKSAAVDELIADIAGYVVTDSVDAERFNPLLADELCEEYENENRLARIGRLVVAAAMERMEACDDYKSLLAQKEAYFDGR